MSSTPMDAAHVAPVPTTAAIDMKLEVIVLPVADVDRAKDFYEGLGWRLDADFVISDEIRAVQVTPPGSPCSIHFGKGLTTAAPGSVQGMILVVEDIEAARADLLERGAEVSELFHYASVAGPRLPGPDPARGSYRSWASFRDPDGNGWLLQEVTTRLPGRGLGTDVPTVTALLREAETRHGEYEPTAPKHHWSAWYAAYFVARENGRTQDEAAREAARRVEGQPH